MQEVFEEFGNNGEAPTEKPVQGAPAPAKSKKKGWVVAGAIALAVVCFLLGALTFWLSLDKGMRKLIWIKDKIDAEYYKDISDGEFYSTLYGAINDGILDPYSHYMTADEYAAANRDMAGSRSGIGLILLTQTAEGEPQILVTRVCGNSPAEKAGIVEGDKIVGFGGAETEIKDSVSFDEFSAFLDERATGEQFFVKLISGGTEKILPLTKENYLENYVLYRTNTTSYGFTKGVEWIERRDALAALNSDTAYIRLTQFGGNAAREFALAMTRFKEEGKTNLILDLRGNGGGYLDIMQDIARYFCKNATSSKPVAAIADYGEKKQAYSASGNDYYRYFTENSRICVLADSSTASASECLIGCMLDYGAIDYADICLSERSGVAKTYGKGIMQTTYYIDLIEQDALKLTTAEIKWPVTKNSIHDRGILPEDGTKTVKESYEKDAEITAAIKALGMVL